MTANLDKTYKQLAALQEKCVNRERDNKQKVVCALADLEKTQAYVHSLMPLKKELDEVKMCVRSLKLKKNDPLMLPKPSEVALKEQAAAYLNRMNVGKDMRTRFIYSLKNLPSSLFCINQVLLRRW